MQFVPSSDKQNTVEYSYTLSFKYFAFDIYEFPRYLRAS